VPGFLARLPLLPVNSPMRKVLIFCHACCCSSACAVQFQWPWFSRCSWDLKPAHSVLFWRSIFVPCLLCVSEHQITRFSLQQFFPSAQISSRTRFILVLDFLVRAVEQVHLIWIHFWRQKMVLLPVLFPVEALHRVPGSRFVRWFLIFAGRSSVHAAQGANTSSIRLFLCDFLFLCANHFLPACSLSGAGPTHSPERFCPEARTRLDFSPVLEISLHFPIVAASLLSEQGSGSLASPQLEHSSFNSFYSGFCVWFVVGEARCCS
jgi:hypothetical protein